MGVHDCMSHMQYGGTTFPSCLVILSPLLPNPRFTTSLRSGGKFFLWEGNTGQHMYESRACSIGCSHAYVSSSERGVCLEHYAVSLTELPQLPLTQQRVTLALQYMVNSA